jgi:hypothetical protein
MTEKPKYNHIKKEFREIVDKAFPNLDILKYYPYGPEVNWENWLTGGVNLKKEYLDERYKDKTELDLVFGIIEDTASAMNYLITHGNDHWFDRQRIEAFALWRLFHNGDCGWSKKNLKGLTIEQKTKLFWKGQNDAEKLSGSNPNENDFRKAKDKETVKIRNNWFNACLKNYGVYEVRIKPLIQYSNTTRTTNILYTRKELCAIKLMVDCYFENLC